MFERARRSLIIWNTLVVLGLLAVVVLVMYFSISNSMEKEVDDELTATANTFSQVPRSPQTGSGRPVRPTPTPTTNASKEDDDDKQQSTEWLRHQEEENRARSNMLSLSSTFSFLLDSSGNVLENSRQIEDTALPDKSVLKQVLAGNQIYSEVRASNGMLVRLYSIPLKQSDGSISGMIQVGRDMTAYQQQLKEVLMATGLVSLGGVILTMVAAFILTRRALVPVRLAMERQREFVADASHELRTPLTLIRANAEVALRSKQPKPAETKELLTDICKETDYLSRLVSDLLTLARADMDKLEVKMEPVELKRLAADVTRQMQPLAENRQLELEVEELEPGRSEIWLSGEEVRLKQLLVILLDNAIKYTPAGQVRLQVGSGGRGQSVVIKVSDTGIGIPHDKLEQIFERFYRVDKARSRSEGGFGLGLSIANWIVKSHHGTIQVNSQVGKGTTFTVTLPVHLPHIDSPRIDSKKLARSEINPQS
jgi:two-component system, OmpR family, sensor histidine kinase CiaH